jgi:hypothetical protein
VLSRLLFGTTLVLVGACEGKRRSDAAPNPAPAPAAPVADPAPPPAGAARPATLESEPAPPPPNLTGKPELVKAGSGEVAPLVKLAADRARAERRRLLVYVGASWCEPCTRFKDALQAGKLDASFPGLRFLEFDMDVDQRRLTTAGYSSRFIPIFAIPGPDGRAAALMQGGIKGPGAVDNLTSRLQQLLAQNP